MNTKDLIEWLEGLIKHGYDPRFNKGKDRGIIKAIIKTLKDYNEIQASFKK